MLDPRPRVLAPLLAAALLASPLARAMVIDCGPTICYQYQESQAAVAVFGLPVRVGDSLQFLPSAALVRSGDVPGSSDVAATFVIDRVYSAAGPLASVGVTAEGDYDATAGTRVGASLELQALNNGGPGSGAASRSFAATGTGGPAQAWNLDAVIEPGNAFAVPTADIRLQLSKVLTAVAESTDGQAWTSVKYIEVSATAVPLPPALGLFAAAAAAAALRGRRRAATGKT